MKNDKAKYKVEAVLKKVRPYIQMHGGDVSLIGFENGIVTIQVAGACVNCKLADLTYNNMVAGLLREEVREIKEVRIIR